LARDVGSAVMGL